MGESGQGRDGGPGGEPGAPVPAGAALAEGLRRAKQDSGLSYSRLAGRVPYSRSTLERYVNGHLLPPRDAVVGLARACGAEPGVLIKLWERAQAEQNAASPAPPVQALPPTPPAGAPVPAAARRRGARRRAVLAGAAAAAVLALVAVLLEQGGSPGAAVALSTSGSRTASPSPDSPAPTGASGSATVVVSAAAPTQAPSAPASSSLAALVTSPSVAEVQGGGSSAPRTAATSPTSAPARSPSPPRSPSPSPSPSKSTSTVSWSGTVEVSNLDLDTDPPTANAVEDWSVDAEPGSSGSKLISSSGPKLAPWSGAGQPGQAACSDLVTAQGVDTLAIAVGDTLCVKTFAGHYASLQITSINAETAMAEAEVWD